MHIRLHPLSRSPRTPADARAPQRAGQYLLGIDALQLETGIHRYDQNHCTLGSGSRLERTGEVEKGSKNTSISERKEMCRDPTWNGASSSGSHSRSVTNRKKARCNAGTLRGPKHDTPNCYGSTMAWGLREVTRRSRRRQTLDIS